MLIGLGAVRATETRGGRRHAVFHTWLRRRGNGSADEVIVFGSVLADEVERTHCLLITFISLLYILIGKPIINVISIIISKPKSALHHCALGLIEIILEANTSILTPEPKALLAIVPSVG